MLVTILADMRGRARLARVVAACLVAVAIGCARPEHHGPLAVSDSVAVRVLYKAWGTGPSDCDRDEWGWDSVTVRLAAKGTMGVPGFGGRRVELRLAKVISPDSAVVAYSTRDMVRLESMSPAPIAIGPLHEDSVVVSKSAVQFTTPSVDGGWYYRVRAVRPWQEPVPGQVHTTRLFGKVIDGTSGRLVPYASVFVLGTRIAGETDGSGRFVLNGVPAGVVRLNVCAFCYVQSRSEVRAPSDSLVIVLGRKPGCTFPS